MAGPVGEKNGSYPFLTRFSTKTLRQLLREDFASREPSTPESDTFITCVAEVVARREAADPGIPHFDVEAGWRKFPQSLRPGDTAPAGSAPPAGDDAGAFKADLARMAAQWTQLQGGEEPNGPPRP